MLNTCTSSVRDAHSERTGSPRGVLEHDLAEVEVAGERLDPRGLGGPVQIDREPRIGGVIGVDDQLADIPLGLERPVGHHNLVPAPRGNLDRVQLAIHLEEVVAAGGRPAR